MLQLGLGAGRAVGVELRQFFGYGHGEFDDGLDGTIWFGAVALIPAYGLDGDRRFSVGMSAQVQWVGRRSAALPGRLAASPVLIFRLRVLVSDFQDLIRFSLWDLLPVSPLDPRASSGVRATSPLIGLRLGSMPAVGGFRSDRVLRGPCPFLVGVVMASTRWCKDRAWTFERPWKWASAVFYGQAGLVVLIWVVLAVHTRVLAFASLWSGRVHTVRSILAVMVEAGLVLVSVGHVSQAMVAVLGLETPVVFFMKFDYNLFDIIAYR